MTPDQVELEMLRKSAAKFMTDPLQRAFFDLECILERPESSRLDSIMPTSSFRVLARALLELKRAVAL